MFRADDDALGVYAEAAGIQRILPRAVAVPADAADVAALVSWAHATGTPLVPRGSGSSMTGAAIGDGVVVDLSRLDWIQGVDATTGSIRAGPGAGWPSRSAATRSSWRRPTPTATSSR